MNWRFKSAQNRANLVRCNSSKAYKKEINKQYYNAYINNFISNLRSLKSLKTKDPKAYLTYLNKSSENSKSVVNKVALETFYDHFKNLTIINNDQNDFNFNAENLNINNNFGLNRFLWRMI